MTPNKKVVETYLTALGNLDWSTVGSCLADDVERIEWGDGFPESGVPVRGKTAVLKGLEAPQKFQIQTIRMTEENNVVATEEVVRVPLKDGGVFLGRACGIFELEGGKLKRMSSWVAEDKRPA
ncbi:MAG: nuclear transport factor 2 family protein [Thermoplasmata archaeon]